MKQKRISASLISNPVRASVPYILLGSVLSLAAARTQGQCVEQQKLTASDADPGDLFGSSVSISEDVAVVGAITAAYVYRFNGTGWVEEQKLTASDASAGDLFGWSSVSVSGNRIVVGAVGDACQGSGFCGAAYVYRYDGTSWVEEQKLTASDALPLDWFGISVSISGDAIVVGARSDSDSCPPSSLDCGAAYVYRFDGTSWVEEQKLTASDAANAANFGWSVSISGDTAVVGAWKDGCTAGGVLCGSAYVYRFNGTTWVEEQKLTASDAAVEDRFGASAAVDGDAAVVGAWLDDCAAGSDCGSAYVYRFNGTSWIEEQKLTAFDAAAGDRFGWSVSVSGDTAVVGAFSDDCAAGTRCGSAYVYRFNGTGWVEKQKLTASDIASGDSFWGSVALKGNTVMIGASGDDCTAGANCGAAFVFHCPSIFVPAASGWGLVVTTLLILSAGTMVVRRRRISTG